MRITLKTLMLSLLLACVSCGDDDDHETAVTDAGPTKVDKPTDKELDAGGDDSEDGGVSAHLRLIALLLELERFEQAECPCLANGDAKSNKICLDQVTFKEGWQDCVADVPLPEDGDEFRERLRCTVAEVRRRNDCYAQKPCDRAALEKCRADMLDCTTVETELLARVVNKCSRSISLFP